MKKVIAGFFIVLVLFNFIFGNFIVYAEDADVMESDSPYMEPASVSEDATATLLEDGEVSQTQGAATKTTLSLGSFGVSAVGMVTGVIARLINVFIIQVDVLLSTLTVTVEDDASRFWYTIERTVFNRVALFNINYFDTDDTYNVGDLEITANASNIKIKEGISNVYYICKMLAIIISLLVLIYIGIRMAISTVASDQAKYKKMFISWAESVILIFVMVYIMTAVMALSESITNILYNIEQDLIDSDEGYGVFEDTIRAQTLKLVFSLSGLQLTIWSIIYWVLLFMEIKFFWLYIKRVLMVGLLITVSPLITITYSIDKAGDGKAQVFAAWTKEFIVNVFIQPLHAMIYLVFVLTANVIATRSPLVALALLMSMGSVERMVKVVFGMSITTLRGVNKFMKKG